LTSTHNRPRKKPASDRTKTSGATRVLVIDDHPESLKAMCLALHMRGHVSKPASTARAALEAVEAFCPQVALLEWNLRSGEGSGLAARLRRASDEQGRSLVVIVVSTQAEPDEFRALEAIDAYFVKPVSIDALLSLFATSK
jgi:DNA-binding response OmpR family regulator